MNGSSLQGSRMLSGYLGKKKKKYNYGEEGLGRVIYSQFGLRHGAFSGMGIWDSDYSFGALS